MARRRQAHSDLCVVCMQATKTAYFPSRRGWVCKSCELEIDGEGAEAPEDDSLPPAWLIDELRPEREAGE